MIDEIGLDYEVRRVTIDSENIKKFKPMIDNRHLRISQVNNILESLTSGKNFDVPIVLNMVDDKMSVIDGNHRIEAIKRLLKVKKDAKIVCIAATYTGLTFEEERQLYHKWNRGLRQTCNDRLRAYQKTVFIIKKLQKSFPVGVHIGLKSNQIGVDMAGLLRAYLTATENSAELSTYSSSPQMFVRKLNDLDISDFNNLKNFAIFFEKTFGRFEKGNLHQTNTMLNSLMTLFIDNMTMLTQKGFIELFKKRVYNCNPIIMFSKKGGTPGLRNTYNAMVGEIRRSKVGREMKVRISTKYMEGE